LTHVLGKLGASANGDYVVFGIEVETRELEEPLVTVSIKEGTLGQALAAVLATVPGYTYELVAPHLINVFPKAERRNPAHVTNLAVASLQLRGIYLDEFLAAPQKYIPELRKATAVEVPKMVSGGVICCGLSAIHSEPGVDLDLTGRTVREDLNLASIASIKAAENGKGRALGWVYAHETKFPAGNVTHRWRVHDFVRPSGHLSR
jgi:hypothetical protein